MELSAFKPIEQNKQSSFFISELKKTISEQEFTSLMRSYVRKAYNDPSIKDYFISNNDKSDKAWNSFVENVVMNLTKEDIPFLFHNSAKFEPDSQDKILTHLERLNPAIHDLFLIYSNRNSQNNSPRVQLFHEGHSDDQLKALSHKDPASFMKAYRSERFSENIFILGEGQTNIKEMEVNNLKEARYLISYLSNASAIGIKVWFKEMLPQVNTALNLLQENQENELIKSFIKNTIFIDETHSFGLNESHILNTALIVNLLEKDELYNYFKLLSRDKTASLSKRRTTFNDDLGQYDADKLDVAIDVAFDFIRKSESQSEIDSILRFMPSIWLERLQQEHKLTLLDKVFHKNEFTANSNIKQIARAFSNEQDFENLKYTLEHSFKNVTNPNILIAKEDVLLMAGSKSYLDSFANLIRSEGVKSRRNDMLFHYLSHQSLDFIQEIDQALPDVMEIVFSSLLARRDIFQKKTLGDDKEVSLMLLHKAFSRYENGHLTEEQITHLIDNLYELSLREISLEEKELIIENTSLKSLLASKINLDADSIVKLISRIKLEDMVDPDYSLEAIKSFFYIDKNQKDLPVVYDAILDYIEGNKPNISEIRIIIDTLLFESAVGELLHHLKKDENRFSDYKKIAKALVHSDYGINYAYSHQETLSGFDIRVIINSLSANPERVLERHETKTRNALEEIYDRLESQNEKSHTEVIKETLKPNLFLKFGSYCSELASEHFEGVLLLDHLQEAVFSMSKEYAQDLTEESFSQLRITQMKSLCNAGQCIPYALDIVDKHVEFGLTNKQKKDLISSIQKGFYLSQINPGDMNLDRMANLKAILDSNDLNNSAKDSFNAIAKWKDLQDQCVMHKRLVEDDSEDDSEADIEVRLM